MEDYAAKMALKPDAELRNYVSGYAQYREAAVLAALAELRHRGQPAPEEAVLRPQLEAVVQTQAAAALAAAPVRPDGAGLPEAEQPTLYTPGVIVLFSVLFNTILTGAVLLALNLRRVGRGRAIWGLAAFVVAYLLGESLLLNYLMKQHYALNPWLLSALNLPAILIYVLWFWPRFVGTYQFRPRGWLLPLLLCFVLFTGLGLLARHLLAYVPGAAQLMQTH